MPTSTPKNITPIAEKILELKPMSALDIGVGFGKWGAIIREYADIWWWRFYMNEWKVWIEGIEVHERYKSPNWNMYNHVNIGLAQEILPKLGKFDVVTFIDVIEHIEKEAALELLKEIMNHTNNLIVSYSNLDQKDVRDNKHEDHISKWCGVDFALEGCDYTVICEVEGGEVIHVYRKT